MDPNGLRRGARSPVAYLRSLIGPGGRVAYARGNPQTPVWVTGEALMALQGKPLPLVAPPAAHTAPAAPAAPQSSTTTASATTRPPATPAPRVTHHHRAARHVAASHQQFAAGSVQAGRWAAAMGVLTALVLAPVDGG